MLYYMRAPAILYLAKREIDGKGKQTCYTKTKTKRRILTIKEEEEEEEEEAPTTLDS
jgi:hypothetical protein